MKSLTWRRRNPGLSGGSGRPGYEGNGLLSAVAIASRRGPCRPGSSACARSAHSTLVWSAGSSNAATSSTSISSGKCSAWPRLSATSSDPMVTRHFWQRPQLSARFSAKHTFSPPTRSGRSVASQIVLPTRLSATLSCWTCSVSVENRWSISGLPPLGPTDIGLSLEGKTTWRSPPARASAEHARPPANVSIQSLTKRSVSSRTFVLTTTSGSPIRSAATRASRISSARTVASWSGSRPSTKTSSVSGPGSARGAAAL